jgi:cytochrome c
LASKQSPGEIEEAKKVVVSKQSLSKIEELKKFVDSGISYIKKHGRKKAFQKFDDPKGGFRKGSLYLFVFNSAGEFLAHGGDPKQFVGKNLLDSKDQFGTPTMRLLIKTARLGGGFVYYYWMNPESKKVEFKTSYVKSFGDEVFIGAGTYELLNVPQQQEVKVEELKTFVRIGKDYFHKHGSAKAFKVFSDPNGLFSKGEWYLFVLDYQGKEYANVDHSLVGRNIFNLTDAFGTPVVQLIIETAKNGGGIISYYWEHPRSKKILLKTSYVLPLDKDYIIGTGYYNYW